MDLGSRCGSPWLWPGQRHMLQSRIVVSGPNARFLLNNAALDRKDGIHGCRRRGAAPGTPCGGSGWRLPGEFAYTMVYDLGRPDPLEKRSRLDVMNRQCTKAPESYSRSTIKLREKC